MRIPTRLIVANSILRQRVEKVTLKSVLTLHNYPEDDSQIRHMRYRKGSPLKLVYIGHLGSHYDLCGVIEYLIALPDLPVSLDIYGDGVEAVDAKKLVKLNGLESKVRFHGRYAAKNIPTILSKYDLGIAPYKKTEFTNTLLPVKIMEYTVNGLASLGTPIQGNKLYFNDGDILYVDSISEFEKTINKILLGEVDLAEMQQKARISIEKLSWSHEREKFLDFIDE